MLRLIVRNSVGTFITYDFSQKELEKHISRDRAKLIGLEVIKEMPAPLPAGSVPRLIDCGERIIAVIKAIREHTGLGLREAKDMADAAPIDLPILDHETMPLLIQDLQAAGATIALPIAEEAK